MNKSHFDRSDRVKIVNKILEWGENCKRNFPWREDVSSYETLIAEIMLQRTLGEKIKGVYKEFLKCYPHPKKLARAERKDIEKIIEPLGLQRQRSRRIKDMAKQIVNKYGGKVPSSYEGLKELQGVGEYVATAVKVFHDSEDRALLDTNTTRIVNRLIGGGSRDEIRENLLSLAKSANDSESFYYSLLDFGSRVCRSTNPKCGSCLINNFCESSGSVK